jgi:hypothetical protein
MGTLTIAALVSPLSLAAYSFFLVGAQHDFRGASVAAVLFLFLPLLSGAALSMVYRWCFSKPAVKGAALLASCAMGVWVLSEPVWLACLAAMIRGASTSEALTEGLVYALVEAMLFVALVCAAVMTAALLVELPFRFLAPQQWLLDDGFFRSVRWIASVVIAVVGSAVIFEEGLNRLSIVLKRLVA